jgi:steroid delta-isomerase-like uncharacterized protein
MADNKQIAEQLLEAWNAGDFERIEGLFADDYVNHNPPPFPGMGQDRAGQLQAMRMFRGAFPDARAETDHIVSEGDLVVLHDRVNGTHEGDFGPVGPTGKRVSVEFIHIFRIADGRIVERWGLIDVMGLMQQLGAAPEMAQA